MGDSEDLVGLVAQVREETTRRCEMPNCCPEHGLVLRLCDLAERMAETNRRLNRRCQEAEVATRSAVEAWERREHDGEIVFASGRLGRAMVVWAWKTERGHVDQMLIAAGVDPSAFEVVGGAELRAAAVDRVVARLEGSVA